MTSVVLVAYAMLIILLVWDAIKECHYEKKLRDVEKSVKFLTFVVIDLAKATNELITMVADEKGGLK